MQPQDHDRGSTVIVTDLSSVLDELPLTPPSENQRAELFAACGALEYRTTVSAKALFINEEKLRNSDLNWKYACLFMASLGTIIGGGALSPLGETKHSKTKLIITGIFTVCSSVITGWAALRNRPAEANSSHQVGTSFLNLAYRVQTYRVLLLPYANNYRATAKTVASFQAEKSALDHLFPVPLFDASVHPQAKERAAKQLANNEEWRKKWKQDPLHASHAQN